MVVVAAAWVESPAGVAGGVFFPVFANAGERAFGRRLIFILTAGSWKRIDGFGKEFWSFLHISWVC